MLHRDFQTLAAARQWLHDQARNGGARCPCCDQFAKVYRRNINSGMARSLITMYRRGGLGWLHIPTSIPARSREEGKLAYWKLVEEAQEPREDGGRAGWWRVTTKGESFIKRNLRLPKFVFVYDAGVLSFDDAETVNIRDCLGNKFDLNELLRS
jgi:hypothetical protein